MGVRLPFSLMLDRLRIRFSKIRKPLVFTVVVTGLIALLVVVFVEVRVNGTGFKGKTLWDWLQLLAALAIPLVVGFGAVWLTTQQGKVADAENKSNQREEALHGSTKNRVLGSVFPLSIDALDT